MVKALLSVKPEYAEKILSGEKIYEFRRRIFKRKDVDILRHLCDQTAMQGCGPRHG